jgi:hypothetical protein
MRLRRRGPRLHPRGVAVLHPELHVVLDHLDLEDVAGGLEQLDEVAHRVLGVALRAAAVALRVVGDEQQPAGADVAHEVAGHAHRRVGEEVGPVQVRDAAREHHVEAALGERQVLLGVAENRPRHVQGSNSARMKYDPVLCAKCNSSRSQPWDRAYDRFIDWVFENERRVLSQRFINLHQVFGDDTSLSCSALYKYFVKAFGCRLADAGFQVPEHLAELLSKDHYETKLRLAFAVHKTLFALRPEYRQQLGLGDLIRIDSRSMGQMERYYFRLHNRWLITSFFYDIEVSPEYGAPWISDSACIYLGEIETATLDELIEAARKVDAPALAELEAMRNSGGIHIE